MIDREQNNIADIGVPKHPLISGPSIWVTFDGNNHCTIQLQNCTPHEISLETGDILGIVDTETTTPIPLDDDSLATIWQRILPTRSISRMINPFFKNNLTYQKPTPNSLSKPWMSG
jgi:hypothetical protein